MIKKTAKFVGSNKLERSQRCNCYLALEFNDDNYQTKVKKKIIGGLANANMSVWSDLFLFKDFSWNGNAVHQTSMS